MCEIRLIKTENKSVISDNIVKLSDVSFGLIDRPAYVLNTDVGKSIDGSSLTGFHFEYLDSSEILETFKENNVMIEFGRQSGRIYTYVGNKEQLKDTTSYAFSQYTKQFGGDQRFLANIRISLKALKSLLSLL